MKLEDLQPEDKVLVDNETVIKIKRITKTMIILKSGQRYNKRTGYSCGTDMWNHSSIKPYQKESI